MVLSITNNNPGNLRPVGSSQGFQGFSTPEDGLQAMRDDLFAKIAGNSPAMTSRYGEGYAPTLENVLSVWAPPSENDTEGYIQFVSDRSGLDRGTPLTPEDIDKFLPAMVQMEGGQKAVDHFFGGDLNDRDLSDEELAQIAGVSLDQPDDGLSDEELARIAGIDLNTPENGLPESVNNTRDQIGAAWQGLKKGATFGFGDEAQAAIAALWANKMGGVDYDTAYNQALGDFRQDYENASKAHPYITFGGEMTGAGLTSAAALGKLSSVNKLAKYARQHPFGAASATGAISGGLYAAGASDGSPQERGAAALVGGGIGAAAGPAGAFLGQKIGSAGSSLLERAKSVLGKKPQPVVNTLDDVAERAGEVVLNNSGAGEGAALAKIKKAIKQDFPDNYEEVFQAWASGDKALIESYGSRLRTLGQGAAQYKSGKAVAQTYFDDVIAEAPEKMKKAVSKNISSVDNYFKTADDILASGRAKAAPLYEEAFKANKSISSKEIDNILATPAGRKALKDAARVMQNDRALMGLPDSELKAIQRDMAAIGKMDDVSGPVASGLNLRTLDMVKKNMDDEISKLYSAGDRQQGKVLNNLKNDLVRELDNADLTGMAGSKARKIDGGAYQRARQASGDYLKVTNSMEAGKQFNKLDPEQIVKAMKNSTEEEKVAFKIGVGKQIRDAIDSKAEGVNPYKAVFGSKTQKDRLAKILSPDEFRNLERSLKAEDRLYQMRNEILGGSPTAGKAQAALEIAGDGAELAQMMKGGITAVPKNTLISGIKKAFDGLNDDTAEQISKILYTTDPQEKVRFLADLSKKVTKDQYKQAQKAYFMLEESIPKGRMAGAVSSAPLSGNLSKIIVTPGDGEKYPDEIDTENYRDTPYGFTAQ